MGLGIMLNIYEGNNFHINDQRHNNRAFSVDLIVPDLTQQIFKACVRYFLKTQDTSNN